MIAIHSPCRCNDAATQVSAKTDTYERRHVSSCYKLL